MGTVIGMQLLWALRKHDRYFDARWRTQRAGGGGPALINLIHDIDLMRGIAGNVNRVYAELGHTARGLEVEDTISATLRFDSGTLGCVLTSDATPSPWGWEQGSGENPNVPASRENCLHILGTAGAISLPALQHHRPRPGGSPDWRTPIESDAIEVGERAALRSQLDEFCRVMRGESAPTVTGADGLAALATTLAVIESGKTGRPIDL
ncbi:MAG: Gfo/Idh/MocA family oxidoreductase [Pseudomonadota bacterium]